MASWRKLRIASAAGAAGEHRGVWRARRYVRRKTRRAAVTLPAAHRRQTSFGGRSRGHRRRHHLGAGQLPYRQNNQRWRKSSLSCRCSVTRRRYKGFFVTWRGETVKNMAAAYRRFHLRKIANAEKREIFVRKKWRLASGVSASRKILITSSAQYDLKRRISTTYLFCNLDDCVKRGSSRRRNGGEEGKQAGGGIGRTLLRVLLVVISDNVRPVIF